MIGSAYDYYLAQYGNSIAKPYVTHKKSELRAIYNSIIKINKNSPLYKIKDSSDVRNYAIDLKESSSYLADIVSKLSDGENYDFTSKQVYSSDESIISAKYIDVSGADDDSQGETLDIVVESLASPQVNEGYALYSHDKDMADGEYSFDLNIGEYTYEFQFRVNPNDTNKSVQEKLARLFNTSNTGIRAEVINNDFLTSSLLLTTMSTGNPGNKERIFSITPNIANPDGPDISDSNGGIPIVDILGINNVVHPAGNALFSINGVSRMSASNTFTINQKFQLTLNGTGNGNAVQVGFKEDIDSAIDNISNLVDGYNHLFDISGSKAGLSFEASRLRRELSGISNAYKAELEAAGMILDEDGYMSVDKNLIRQSFNEGNLNKALDGLSPFNGAILRKANSISLNPMGYVDKKLITYPNPSGNFAGPYSTSVYSGMMFNGYV